MAFLRKKYMIGKENMHNYSNRVEQININIKNLLAAIDIKYGSNFATHEYSGIIACARQSEDWSCTTTEDVIAAIFKRCGAD